MSTAWAEYKQGFVQHPALIAQLELRGAHLVDATDPDVLQEWSLDKTIYQLQWRSDLNEAAVLITHVAQQQFVDAGVDGVIYPSFMSPGGSCVALWHWNDEGGPVLSIVDPDDRLPTSPASRRRS